MTGFLFVVGLIDLALLVYLAVNWRALPNTGRVAMGGVVFAALPLSFGFATVVHGLNSMKSTDFCGSCHVMEPYMASLQVDDDDSLVAVHYQNNWTKQKTACYDCHSEYGMFGDMKAKIAGLKHVYVNYITGPPKLADIKLYEPYKNQNCLHCHAPGKRFQENEDHADNKEDLDSGETSCLDCHDVVHMKGD